MKTVGIIAEFNPFHKGHEYLISEAKKKTGADRCMIVMSGSFTQRGEPAFMNRYDRTKAALSCGADLVLELPVSYATATAEVFAYGAVSILDSTGIADSIAFGVEDDELKTLERIADILLDPPKEYTEKLNNSLKEGLSYPAARANALNEYGSVLDKPNNILAIEYIKAVKRLGSDMTVIPIRRIGSGYHDLEICDISSAEAIREAISKDIGSSFDAMPEKAAAICRKALGVTCPVGMDDMTDLARYAFLTASAEQLSVFQDMNRDLAARFLKTYTDHGDEYMPLSEIIGSMRTKELTYSRLSRAALHVILSLNDMTRDNDKMLLPSPYARILGFKSDASDMMRRLSDGSKIPLINKAGDAYRQLNGRALDLFEANVRADRIHDLIIHKKFGTRLTDGCRISPVII